jgi:hypothetical protein
VHGASRQPLTHTGAPFVPSLVRHPGWIAGQLGLDVYACPMGGLAFTGVKVFSTTLARDREVMGESITRWLRENPSAEVLDKVVTQSSDKEFHCLTITLFYKTRT